MNRTVEVIMRNEVGWALNRLLERTPPSLIGHSDPEMVQRFSEVASSYLHQGFESKSIETKFAQEITRQVDTVKYVDHFLIAGLLMRAATDGLNRALRLTQAEKQNAEPDPHRTPKTTKLEQLRRAFGFTYEQLAEETGKLDEKTVRLHCHGKQFPRPANIKVYIDLFNRLGQKITPSDLRS